MFYKNKKVLIAGGTGTIGIPVVKQLQKLGAQVTVVSLLSDEKAYNLLGNNLQHIQLDLTDLQNCLCAVSGQEYVVNLLGRKGSVGIGSTKAASYFYSALLCQTQLMEAAFRYKVERYLYVSSICGYPAISTLREEDCWWNGKPTQNDGYVGLVKRIGEIQAEVYMKEHNWDAVRIIRPTVVYGPYDDFNSVTGHVTPALINRITSGENPLVVWGDGSAVRDFIYSEEVAKWMLVALEKAPPCVPINLGSGVSTTIKSLVETILSYVKNPPCVKWDTTKPVGDLFRVLSTKKAEKYLGFKLEISLEEGIRKTVNWYCNQEK